MKKIANIYVVRRDQRGTQMQYAILLNWWIFSIFDFSEAIDNYLGSSFIVALRKPLDSSTPNPLASDLFMILSLLHDSRNILQIDYKQTLGYFYVPGETSTVPEKFIRIRFRPISVKLIRSNSLRTIGKNWGVNRITHK